MAAPTHLADFVVKRDASRLDSDTTVSLVLTSVRETLIAGRSHGNDTSRRNQGVRESGLACTTGQAPQPPSIPQFHCTWHNMALRRACVAQPRPLSLLHLHALRRYRYTSGREGRIFVRQERGTL